MRGLTTDDDPEYGPALRETGLDRQQCTVHMQRTVGRHLRRIDDDDPAHLDRALLPILQRLVRERPPEAGPVLLGLREAVAQGRVRLRDPVRNLLFHLVENRADLVRNERDPDVPAPPNRIEGWFGRSGPGPGWRGGRGPRRGPQLRAPDGRRHGLKRARTTDCRETADDGPPPISTRLKQCPAAGALSVSLMLV